MLNFATEMSAMNTNPALLFTLEEETAETAPLDAELEEEEDFEIEEDVEEAEEEADEDSE